MHLWDLLLFVAGLPFLVVSGYLLALTLAARRRPAPPYPPAQLKFDFVVPAHDEELGIAATVRSLDAVDYPQDKRRILVVADNCTDQTAARAREAGALVLERVDAQKRGKGYALAHAFERSRRDGFADAVVVVDADSRVSGNLLQAFAARLGSGARAVQAYYGVLNPQASWRTRLMTIALALFHLLRSLGRERLELSSGLRGNGMCLSTDLLREVPYDAFSIVEDVEYGIRLGRRGIRVHFAWEASVRGEMVSGERASRSQRKRWELGRLRLAAAEAPTLFRQAYAKKDLLLADLAFDLIVPPLTLVVLAAVVGTGVALLTGSTLSWYLFVACDLALLTYVGRGLVLSGVGPRGVLDLAWAPFYMAWKVVLLLGALGRRSDSWVRTTRESETR